MLLLALMVAGSATAQKSIEFTKYTLDNGLTVILHQDATAPIVAVNVTYHVGAKNDPVGRSGFAHFFEHLLFEGTENVARGDFAKFVQDAGGVLNAYTTNDQTTYYEILPANQIGLGLWLESERMLHAKVLEEGIETQRSVVKEERRMRVDNRPYGQLAEQLFGMAYKEHPYRYSTIGSMDDLDAASEADYQNFYKNYYVPNNAVLVLAGDFEMDATKKMVQKYFGTIPRGKPIQRVKTVEPAMTTEVRDTFYDNIQLPAVVMGYRIPGKTHADYPAVDMLGQLLSQGASSRMNRRLVDEMQLAVAAGNQSAGLEDPGIVLTFAIANVGVDPAKLETEINALIKEARDTKATEREFQKLRNQVESDFISGYGSMEGIAGSLADFETYYGDANLINKMVDQYLAVTPDDLQRVAKKYFTDNNRVVLYYLPKPM